MCTTLCLDTELANKWTNHPLNTLSISFCRLQWLTSSTELFSVVYPSLAMASTSYYSKLAKYGKCLHCKPFIT